MQNRWGIESTVALACAIYLGLHLFFSFWGGAGMWGLDSLAYLPRWVRLAVALAALLLLLPAARNRFLHPVDRLLGGVAAGRTGRRLALAGLLLVAAVVFYFLRSATHLLGDGYLLIRDLGIVRAEIAWGGVNAPLSYWLLRTVYRLLQWSPESVLVGVSIVCGLLYVFTAAVGSRAVSDEVVDRCLVVGLLITAGYVALFCGYAETYVLLPPALLVYLLSGLRSLRTGRDLLVPAVAAGLLGPLHLGLVVLWPSFAVLVFLVYRAHEAEQPRLRRLVAKAQWCLLPPTVSAVVLAAIHFRPGDYLAHLKTTNLLPLLADPGGTYHYGLASAAHLQDLLNLYLLTAPAAVLLLPLVARRRAVLGDRRRFLGTAALFPVAFTLLANPEVGAFRDWDAFSFAAVPLTLWAGSEYIARFRSFPGFRRAGLLVCLAAGLHTLLWVGLNADRPASESRFSDLLGRAHLSPQARSYGWETLGAYLRDADRFAEAAQAFDRAARANPQNPRLWISLGNAHLEAGHYDEALAAFHKVIDLDLDATRARQLAQAYTSIGNTESRQKKWDQAIDHYRKAADLVPGYARAHYTLGVALQKSGRMEEAIAAYREALACAPGMVEAYLNLGNVFDALGKKALALDSYRQAVATNPRYVNARFNLAIAWRDAGVPDSARAHFREVLRLAPDFPQAAAIRQWLSRNP